MLVSGGGITLAYDPLMRLYQASTTRWAYDGATMIAEYNSSNALLRRFVHGPGVEESILIIGKRQKVDGPDRRSA